MTGKNWQEKGFDHVVKYFKKVYSKKNISVESAPWVTGAVGIELQKLVLDQKFSSGSSVLEIGCGIGTESVYLAKQGMSVTALDINEDILKLAEMNAIIYGADVDFRQGDFLTIDLKANNLFDYDLVIDQGCFHHTPPQERENYARQLNKSLKSNGLYFMRGFSDGMPPSRTGDGPIRLTSDDILKTFLPYLLTEELYCFRNLPVPRKEDVPQIFWAYLGRKR